eukprot:Gb_34643 [translate_table: standard]
MQTLTKLIKGHVDGLKQQMVNRELVRELGRDAKTKVRINETLMGLLLLLDTIQLSFAPEEAVKDGEISNENLSLEEGEGKINTPHIDVGQEASEHENNESFSKVEIIANDMYEENSPEEKDIQPSEETRGEEKASVAIKDEGEYHSVEDVVVESEEFIDKSQDALNIIAKLAIEGEDYILNYNEAFDTSVGGLSIRGESSDFTEEEKAIGSSPKVEGNLCLIEISMEEGDSTTVEEKDVFNSMAKAEVLNKSFKAFQTPQTLMAFAFHFETQFPPWQRGNSVIF